MSGFFNPENKIFTGLNKMVDMIILSVLWFICCIPVITFGASSSALYYAYHKSIRQKRGYAWKEFFHGFKINFKQATIAWLILLVLYIITGLDCVVLYGLLDTMSLAGPLLLIIIFVTIMITIWAIFLFAYIARFENSLKLVLKNSFFVALANIFLGFLMFIILVVAMVLPLVYPLFVFIVPAVYILLINKIMERIFRKYMTEEDIQTQKEWDRNK